MTRDEEERLAKARYSILVMLRASGVLLMVLGLWIWHGDILEAGGWPALGAPLFVVGLVESLVLPRILAGKWRTPPEA